MIDVKFKFERLSDMTALEKEWRELETRSAGSYFTSWAWISTWLRFAHPHVRLTVSRGYGAGRLLALGVLAVKERARGNRVLLHAADHVGLDSIYVELNGLLFARQLGTEPVSAFLDALRSADFVAPWSELILPGVRSGDLYSNAATKLGYLVRCISHPAPRVDLTAFARDGSKYDLAISKKGRYQARRAIRDYEKQLGRIAVVRAATRVEASAMLAELAAFHTRTWRARGAAGAFHSSDFVAFHQSLIDEFFEEGNLDLLRIKCGETTVGIFYLLCYRATACFYQSGYDYSVLEVGNQPGYLCVPAVIRYYLNRSFLAFDFMAGDAVYKTRLATDTYQLSWLVIERATPIRRVKHAIGGIVSAARRRLA